MSKATIFVTFQQVGFHRWADAPAARSYLADLHRHVFHVRVETDVDHDDREIEFHDLMDEAIGMFRSLRATPWATSRGRLNLGTQSCEMLARRLGTMLADQHQRPFVVTVSEDGECGAVVTAKPEGAE